MNKFQVKRIFVLAVFCGIGLFASFTSLIGTFMTGNFLLAMMSLYLLFTMISLYTQFSTSIDQAFDDKYRQ